VQNLSGHKRKVGNVRWHPTASNVLATSSTDYTVKVWDVEKGAAKCHVDGHADIIQSIDWNYEGSLITTACKDKKIRVIDPRTGQVVSVRIIIIVVIIIIFVFFVIITRAAFRPPPLALVSPARNKSIMTQRTPIRKLPPTRV
jgi:WD40 repeat protein